MPIINQRVQKFITKASTGRSYAPPFCGSLRSLYRKMVPLHCAHVAGVEAVEKHKKNYLYPGNTRFLIIK